MQIIDLIRRTIRAIVQRFARWLNSVTGGKIHPDVVTMVGFLMHLPIAYFIACGSFYIAAVLLVIFGLFDTLDGELARLQSRAGLHGMLLDALTDRLKEVMLYAGAAYNLSGSSRIAAVWCVLACGSSLCVSYIKAKGEAALASKRKNMDHHTLNYYFKDGLMSFEVRMSVLLIGLVFHELFAAVVLIAVMSLYTIIPRYRHIAEALK
jgi:phosphatidylglycerophosphate synthase